MVARDLGLGEPIVAWYLMQDHIYSVFGLGCNFLLYSIRKESVRSNRVAELRWAGKDAIGPSMEWQPQFRKMCKREIALIKKKRHVDGIRHPDVEEHDDGSESFDSVMMDFSRS